MVRQARGSSVMLGDETRVWLGVRGHLMLTYKFSIIKKKTYIKPGTFKEMNMLYLVL